jgi:hypothetical protein
VVAALAILGIVALALLATIVVERRAHARERAQDAARHQEERERLADRIQRPDMLPLRGPSGTPPEPADPTVARAFARIGTAAPYREPSPTQGEEG